MPVIVAIVVLYPDASRPRGILGAVGIACILVAAFGLCTSFVAPFDGLANGPDSVFADLESPISTDFFSRFDADGALWYGPPSIVASLLLIVRWLRASGELRQVLRWLVASQFVGAIFAPLPLIDGSLFILSVQLPTIPFLAALTAGTLRHRVYGIDVVVQRTFVYGALLVCVAAVYGAIVGATVLLAGAVSPLASFSAAIVAALALAPARSWIERGVNRFLFGRRDDPYAVLSSMGMRLEAAGTAGNALSEFVVEVRSALRVPYVAIELDELPDARRIEAGAPVGEAVRFPLLARGVEIGALLVGLRSGERAFEPREAQLLVDLARQAAVAAENRILNEDLRRSRERIVTAREEERRRLRRDLHDGLGPILTGAAMLIDAGRNLMETDRETADSQFSEARSQVRGAIDDVRRLVYELRPPALDELGLVGALRERLPAGGLDVSVVAPEPFPPLPAAVEVAAFRIVSEAVTNAARHSGATECCVELRLDDVLEIHVRDNGRTDSPWRPGVGIISMRERAAELGGICQAGPGPTGHGMVRAWLPVESP
ncbi:MAG: sensor histidine kinase [Dehalococcoidia bacterium]|nr:sensor histidine kinase [Dehalococcoidia bacterium]